MYFREFPTSLFPQTLRPEPRAIHEATAATPLSLPRHTPSSHPPLSSSLPPNPSPFFAEVPRDFLGFRDKPNGVVLLDECNVRLRDEKSTRPFTFVLSHAGGESVVLAAESEKEMHEWMQAVRTSRMCVSDSTAANMLEEARRVSADKDLDSARDKRTDPEAELSRIEGELESVQAEHRQLEVEKESAEKQLKELMARFKLRKALLHWRHRKLTLSFRSLVTMVFRTRIEEAKRLKDGSDRRISSMEGEMARATADRQRAEMAKRARRPARCPSSGAWTSCALTHLRSLVVRAHQANRMRC